MQEKLSAGMVVPMRALILFLVLPWAGASLGGPILPPDLPKRAGDLAAHSVLETILADLARQRETLVKIQRELVARPGVNPEDGGDGEEAKARWIEDWLLAEGLPPPERIDYPDERVPTKIRPNFILRHPAVHDDRPTFWVVAYLDNTPAGDEKAWIGSATSLRFDGDRMYGLGVQDNNDGIAAALLLLRSLHKYAVDAPFNFGALLTAGEKRGNVCGFTHVVAMRPDLFKPSDRFLALSFGMENGAVIEIGEKGVIFVEIVVRGRQAHSAQPQVGRNALAAAADLIAMLPRLEQRFPAKNALFEPAGSTFTPTRPRAPDLSYNQVPGEFAFLIDVRLLPEYRLDDVMAAVRELAEETARKFDVEVRVDDSADGPKYPPSPLVPPDAPEVLALKRAVKAQLDIEPRLCGVGGRTIAGDLRDMGFHALVWRIAAFQEHGANESMSIKDNLDEAAVIARLLFDKELAEAPPALGACRRTRAAIKNG